MLEILDQEVLENVIKPLKVSMKTTMTLEIMRHLHLLYKHF